MQIGSRSITLKTISLHRSGTQFSFARGELDFSVKRGQLLEPELPANFLDSLGIQKNYKELYLIYLRNIKQVFHKLRNMVSLYTCR